jgi:predicted acetyltransferase
MDVTLAPVRPEEQPVVTRLLQLYYYDFSELLGFDIGDDGRFTTWRAEGYWTDARYRPFLIRAGEKLAGLAIVDSLSRLSGEPCWDMNEFFVLRRHRRTGVGTRAAALVFDAFPGRWEVRQILRNEAAQGFWRKVIAGYTGGGFQEVTLDDERWKGPVQSFESAARRGA